MHKFILTYFISIILIFSLLMGFVIAVDPYDKLGINVFGFETKAVAFARENKFNMLQNSKKKYDAFILGSSSAHRFHTEVVERVTGLKTFNYALQHTTAEDYIAILRHILSLDKPKLILLQMDFYVLNKHFETDTRFYTSPLKKYLKDDYNTHFKKTLFDNNYLTLEALRDSFRVVGVNLFGQSRHIYLEDGNYHKEARLAGQVKISQYGYENYQLDMKRISYLKEIQRICDENKIDLIVWSSPRSIKHYEKMMSDSKVKEKLLEYKKTLKEIFPHFVDLTTAEMGKYNTTEYFMDSTHPTAKLSDLLMEQILKKEFVPR